MSAFVFAKTVGCTKCPPEELSYFPPATTSPPSDLPDSIYPETFWNCSSETNGPISVDESIPGPTLIWSAIFEIPSVTLSKTFSCANNLEPAQQHCPWLKNMAEAAPAIAASISASGKIIVGDLPPNSNETFLRLPAAAFVINLPTSVEPVKATLSTWGWDARGAPASSPNPVTKFNTPSGRIPESWIISINLKADNGVCSAGLRTIVHPAAKAGAIFHAAINSGKFHGIIWPTTPTGSLTVYEWYCAPGVYGTEIGIVSPSILVAQPAIYLKISEERGTSAAPATATGLPLSSDSSWANSSAWLSIKSPIFHIIFPFSLAGIPVHFPESNASLAALTAKSISLLFPAAQEESFFPVAGSSTSNVFEELVSTHLPPIYSFWFLFKKLATLSLTV